MENTNQEQLNYLFAQKKVKQIRGFYSHLLVYLVINSIVLFINIFYEKERITDLNNYLGAIVWGVGLLIHACIVFLPNFVFGNEWEERKVREIMEKQKQYN